MNRLIIVSIKDEWSYFLSVLLWSVKKLPIHGINRNFRYRSIMKNFLNQISNKLLSPLILTSFILI